jgi:Cft2 family RNA processing exonuclease
MLAIIDDTVENGFMQAITKSIESEPDNKPLEDNFDMNEKMQSYLKQTYKNRTVTGIRENNMEKQVKKSTRIKEEISSTPVKQASGITTISKDLNDQASNFRTINNKEKMAQLLDALISKLDPKFVQSSLFKVAVREFYNKYK